MKERPILFSAPMVRAILEDRKTQTRRIVKPQPTAVHGRAGHYAGSYQADGDERTEIVCPYGQPGDRLWVRETWAGFGDSSAITPPVPHSCQVRYKADGKTEWLPVPAGAKGVFPASLKNRPSIHMPRWASRITLELTAVRMERLQNISEADAIAEGIEIIDSAAPIYRDYGEPLAQSTADDPRQGMCFCPVRSYETLWNSINGPCSWDANPFVWVLTFRRL